MTALMSPEQLRRIHAHCGDGHCPPSCGTFGGHFVVDAPLFLVAAGYDPNEHPEVIADLRQALAETVVDTAYDVMREHGLKPETDPTAPVWTPVPAEESAR